MLEATKFGVFFFFFAVITNISLYYIDGWGMMKAMISIFKEHIFL